jgi:hypothetical protein
MSRCRFSSVPRGPVSAGNPGMEADVKTILHAWKHLRKLVGLADGHRRVGRSDADSLAQRPDQVATLILREQKALVEAGERDRDLAAARAEIEALRIQVVEGDLERRRIACELRRARAAIEFLRAI